MMLIRKIIIIGIACFAPLILVSQEYPSVNEIKNVIKKEVENGRTSSIVVGILDHGKVDFICHGNPIEGKSYQANKTTIYEIASISKIFTNILVADLILKGKLDINDPVIKYLPDTLRFQNKKVEMITLKHLSTHTSGLPRRFEEIDLRKMDIYHKNYTFNDLFNSLEDYQFKTNPGSQYQYSNKNTALLAYVLCQVTGKDLDDLFRERIYEPFQMRNSTLYLSKEQEEIFATAYARPGRPIPHWEWKAEAGAGGLRSNAQDLIIFMRKLFYDDSPLTETAKYSIVPQFDSTDIRNTKIGIGFFITEMGKSLFVGHGGETNGFKSFMVYDVKNDRGVTVLSNSSREILDICLYCFDKNHTINEFEMPINLEIDTKEFERFEGTYSIGNVGFQDTVEVYMHDKLYFIYSDNIGEFELFYQGKNTFMIEGTKIKFKKYVGNKAQIIKGNRRMGISGRRVSLKQ